MGWKVFLKPSTPIFFIGLYFIGAGGDETLKNYLAWPYHRSSVMAQTSLHICAASPGHSLFLLIMLVEDVDDGS